MTFTIDELKSLYGAALDGCRFAEAQVIQLRRELAAAQAREKVLRDALKVQPRNLRTVWKDGIDLDLPDRVTERRDEALAMPTDDSALKAALAAERERCIGALMGLPSNADLSVQEAIDAIRALENE